MSWFLCRVWYVFIHQTFRFCPNRFNFNYHCCFCFRWGNFINSVNFIYWFGWVYFKLIGIGAFILNLMLLVMKYYCFTVNFNLSFRQSTFDSLGSVVFKTMSTVYSYSHYFYINHLIIYFKSILQLVTLKSVFIFLHQELI